MLTAETKRRIDHCRDVLVGKLPLPTDQVELITLALIYKFMDDMDEDSAKLGGRRAFLTDLLAAYRWPNIVSKTLPAKDRMELFAAGLEALGDSASGAHLPELFRDIFRNAFLKFRDGKTFALFASEIDGFTYAHSEELGNAFEYLLLCMGTQGENGQFRTPRHIIGFVIAALDPKPGERLLDPACGTGGFLVEAYQHILRRHSSPGAPGSGDLLKTAAREKLHDRLSGYDITDLMVKLSKVNLFLHGFPSPHIHIYDTLSNDARWDEKADIIAANPPFMTPKGGVTPHGRFRIPAKKAEVLFTDYIAEHLAPGGRAGIIVPNGIVATTQNAYVKLRKYLIEDGLVAVVSLPAGVFRPYSGVKTSILFLDKPLARKTKEVLFLKIVADGHDLGDKRTPGGPDDLPEAQRVLAAWFAGNREMTSPLSFKLVPKAELLAHKSHSLQAEQFLGGSDCESGGAQLVPIREICALISGQHIDKEDYNTEGRGIGYLTGPSDFGETHPIITKWTESPKALARAGDVLLTVKGSGVGSVNLVETGEVAISRQLMAVRAEGVEPGYLHAVLLRKKDHFASVANGAAIPGITREHVLNLEIPLPPLDEQRRIVAEIEGYQNRIAALENEIKQTTQYINQTMDKVWAGE